MGEIWETMPYIGPTRAFGETPNLRDVFQSVSSKNANDIAVLDSRSGSSLTFAQLAERSIQLARILLEELRRRPNGNPHGDNVIAVCFPPSPDLIVALLAILKAGLCYLPLEVDFPRCRVDHILQDSQPTLVIVHGSPPATSHLEDDLRILHFHDLSQKMINTNSSDISDEELLQPVTVDSLVAVLYTSGSTGVPKGVRLSQRALINRFCWQWEAFPYSEHEVGCFKTSLTFVDSMSEIFAPLLQGHKVVVIPKDMVVKVETLVDILSREKVGRLILVPSLLRSILLYCSESNSPSLPHLRMWICSGEVFPPDLLRRFFEMFTKGQKICNFYGSTEVMGDVTFIVFENLADVDAKLSSGNVPIGKCISNTAIYLLDGNLSEVAQGGEIGEIYVGGENLASGYVRGIESERFLQNPFGAKGEMLFKTGDYSKLVNGYLTYEGRSDSQVKVRGHRVDLSEVQNIVQSVEGVASCQVVCHKLGTPQQTLVGFYTTATQLCPKDLKDKLSKKLPGYMRPQLIQLPSLPLLVNGKVDRQLLLRICDDRSKNPPCTDDFDLTQCPSAIHSVCTDLLNTIARTLGPSCPSRLSLADNFFEVGGNSLNVILAITSVRDLGYNIGISQFVEAKSFLEIVQNLKKAPIHITAEKDVEEIELPAQELLFQYLKDDMKEEVISLMTSSFIRKGDLEQYVDTTVEDYNNYFYQIWSSVVSQELSFALIHPETHELKAVSISMDLYKEPTVDFISRDTSEYVFDYLDDIESQVRDQIPKGPDLVIHSVFMGTSENSSPAENVFLTAEMEKHNIRIAKEKGYEAIFTTNTSEITQYICDDLLGYKVLSDNQINTWVAKNGHRPYEKAPEETRAVCSVKYI